MGAFACPNCGQRLELNGAVAPARADCPRCGTVEPTPLPDSATLPLEPAPSAAAPAPSEEFIPTLAGAPAPSGGPFPLLAPAQTPGELGRLGSYRVLAILGTGGMGVVYKAEDPHLERLVALKVLRPELNAQASFRQRFLREARLTAAIKHDHVLTIHQVGEDRGVPYLAMEYLLGESLRTRLDRDKVLPMAEVLRIGREIAEGLAAAHAGGLIHRDIKPGNIWLESREGLPPRVKILDFGLAYRDRQEGQLTRPGTVVGSPAYMAPEQARGDSLDARCDLFSLGCVLYRACTGVVPFPGDDTLSILNSLATITPTAPRAQNAAIPPLLSDLVMTLLAKERERRPASAAVVADTLRKLEGKREGSGTDVIPLQRTPTTPRSHRKALALTAAGLVLAGAVCLVVRGGSTAPPQPPPDTVEDPVAIEPNDRRPIPPDPKPPPGVEEVWLKVVAGMPPDAQAQAVAAKLRELNPGFDGACTHTVTGGAVEIFAFKSDKVTNIAPVRALTRLGILSCNAIPGRSKLADLSPLRGMHLRIVEFIGTDVADLSPLRGMPLERVMFGGTPVRDLSPLEGARIHSLDLNQTKVADLSPLRGMPVSWLLLNGTRVNDLAPLAGKKTLQYLQIERTPLSNLDPLRDTGIEQLNCNLTRVADLTPVAGMKHLRRLEIIDTPVKDLSPLRGTAIDTLFIHQTAVTDLAPLKDMPKLKDVSCSIRTDADRAVLRSIPTLKMINFRPAEQVLNEPKK